MQRQATISRKSRTASTVRGRHGRRCKVARGRKMRLFNLFWNWIMATKIGSLISRVVVNRNFVKSIIYIITPHLFWGIFIRIRHSYDRFYHELRVWTNDTNVAHFSIRAIRLFVPFVIPTHLMPHRQNSPTRCLQLELPKSQKIDHRGSQSAIVFLCVPLCSLWFSKTHSGRRCLK